MMIPSPSGSKLLVVRNPENDSPTKFEIWGPSLVEKESVFLLLSMALYIQMDGLREYHGTAMKLLLLMSLRSQLPRSLHFLLFGYKKENSTDKDCGSWKGQGDWKRRGKPMLEKDNLLFSSLIGEVRPVEGIGKSLSVGQVVWAPSSEGLQQAPFSKKSLKSGTNAASDVSPTELTQSISSAFFPRFSPDGKLLMFLSARSSVDSWAHSATHSLHRIDCHSAGKPTPDAKIVDVIPVVICPEDGCFPGLYCFSLLSRPWLSDGYTMILSSIWGSTQVIISVNVISGNISRISSETLAWNVLASDGDNIIAATSLDVPAIKYGSLPKASTEASWSWLDVSSPISRCSEKVTSLLSSLQFSIMKIPVRDISKNLTKGASKPYEAIFVSSKPQSRNSWLSFSSLGYSLLIVNYRGSLGFGEEAVQSLLGKIGSQDVNDVLAAIDHVIEKGLADPSKIAVLGGSYGGFLTISTRLARHQMFAAAVARNPPRHLEIRGNQVLQRLLQLNTLTLLLQKSPILHISKVRTPTLFLLGAKDLRVPMSTGLQYARALKEKGVEVKVIVFPEDNHALDSMVVMVMTGDGGGCDGGDSSCNCWIERQDLRIKKPSIGSAPNTMDQCQALRMKKAIGSISYYSGSVSSSKNEENSRKYQCQARRMKKLIESVSYYSGLVSSFKNEEMD
ncbi:hypothetical protein HAX54_039076 [Datura stramonium]|uniref:acylaminoacyl-peptidase n=1 Tax=Datura stramonium TaxID=4076 RepID=A0ABS8VKR9_DATST|nr:hypothetical protein [Datura stramonium]